MGVIDGGCRIMVEELECGADVLNKKKIAIETIVDVIRGALPKPSGDELPVNIAVSVGGRWKISVELDHRHRPYWKIEYLNNWSNSPSCLYSSKEGYSNDGVERVHRNRQALIDGVIERWTDQVIERLMVYVMAGKSS